MRHPPPETFGKAAEHREGGEGGYRGEVAEEPVLVPDQQPAAVGSVEQLRVRRIVGHAPGIRAEALQFGDAKVLNPIRHSEIVILLR